MKWIEIVDNSIEGTYLLNTSHIKRIWIHENVIFFSLGGSPYEILSESAAEAQIKYDLIKSYINYGPTPNGLTIESE